MRLMDSATARITTETPAANGGQWAWIEFEMTHKGRPYYGKATRYNGKILVQRVSKADTGTTVTRRMQDIATKALNG